MPHLTKHNRDFIGRCLSSGRYANKSEVVRAGLRLLEEHERMIKAETPDKRERDAHRYPLAASKQRGTKDSAGVPVEGDKRSKG